MPFSSLEPSSLVSRARGGGGLSDLRLADGLMTLVDELNLKGVSPLAREVLGWRQRAQEGITDL